MSIQESVSKGSTLQVLVAGEKIYYRYSVMELCSKSLASVTSHTAIDNSPASLGLILKLKLTRLICSTLQELTANEGRHSTAIIEDELLAGEQVNLLPAEQEPFVAEQGQVPLLAAEQEPLLLFVAELELLQECLQECQQETGPPLPSTTAELVIGR